jgi:multidrug resistance efflux pump
LAEIPIERKPRSRGGALIALIVLILIAVGAWYWWSMQSKSPTATALVETGDSPAMLFTPKLPERG